MDGSARSAPRPSTLRAASHTSRSPHMCNGNRTGSSGTMAEGSWRTTSGNPESRRGTAGSRAQFREPERRLFRLGDKIGESNFQRCRARDQDHVIPYSHPAERRISAEQLQPSQLAQPAASPISVDRALERPADRDADPALVMLTGHSEGDHGSAAVKPFAADRSLELGLPAQPEAPLHCRLGGQPEAALASAVLHNAHSAACAHPAQESVHATAIPLLGLEGSLDGVPLQESLAGENRGSVPEDRISHPDIAFITLSAGLHALRCPQGFATLPARKQPG